MVARGGASEGFGLRREEPTERCLVREIDLPRALASFRIPHRDGTLGGRNGVRHDGQVFLCLCLLCWSQGLSVHARRNLPLWQRCRPLHTLEVPLAGPDPDLLATYEVVVANPLEPCLPNGPPGVLSQRP